MKVIKSNNQILIDLQGAITYLDNGNNHFPMNQFDGFDPEDKILVTNGVFVSANAPVFGANFYLENKKYVYVGPNKQSLDKNSHIMWDEENGMIVTVQIK